MMTFLANVISQSQHETSVEMEKYLIRFIDQCSMSVNETRLMGIHFALSHSCIVPNQSLTAGINVTATFDRFIV